MVVERELALAKRFEIVNVLPTLHAGGSGQLAAFDYMKDPVEGWRKLSLRLVSILVTTSIVYACEEVQ